MGPVMMLSPLMGTKGKDDFLWFSMIGKGIADRRTLSGGPVMDGLVWVVVVSVSSMTG